MSPPPTTVTLTKGANAALPADRLRVVLSWLPGPGVPDVDVSALLCGPDGKVGSHDDFVFFNQPCHPSGAVTHSGKAGVAGSTGDVLDVELARLPTSVETVTVTASCEGRFGKVAGLEVSIYDTATPAVPLLRFPMTPGAETALIAGEFCRRAGAWKFRAVAQGYTDGLAGLARDFGISVEDPTPEPLPQPVSRPVPQSVPQSAPQPTQPVPQPVAQPAPGAGGIDWLNPPVPAGYGT